MRSFILLACWVSFATCAAVATGDKPKDKGKPAFAAIDKDTIAAYAKLGAKHAKLKKSGHGPFEFSRILVEKHDPVELPGFAVDRLDAKLPAVDVPFGISTTARCTLSDDRLKHLAHLKNLRLLDLLGGGVTDKGLKELAGLENLTDLYLQMTDVTDEGMKTLAAMKQLRLLCLAGTDVSDKGVKELSRHENLTALDLRETKVTAEGLKELGAMRKLSAIYFQPFHVNDAVVAALAKAGKLPALYTGLVGGRIYPDGVVAVDLTGTKVTNNGLNVLADVKNLAWLSVQYLRVDDDGVIPLSSLKSLRHLDLRSTHLSKAGVANLRKALPKCEILEP